MHALKGRIQKENLKYDCPPYFSSGLPFPHKDNDGYKVIGMEPGTKVLVLTLAR